jgi:hypothetical protein
MFIKEQQLFEALKNSFIPDLEKSENPMDRYDCYSLAHNIDIELKCRRKHYDDLLIEKKKYDALLLRASNFGTDPVYINSTPSGVWVFRLTVVPEPEWETRGMPKTSEFRQRQFIDKVVGYYNVVKGTEITDKLK